MVNEWAMVRVLAAGRRGRGEVRLFSRALALAKGGRCTSKPYLGFQKEVEAASLDSGCPSPVEAPFNHLEEPLTPTWV